MVIIGAYVGDVTTEAESSISNTYLMRKSKEHNHFTLKETLTGVPHVFTV